MSKLKHMNSDKEMNAVRFNMKEQRCLQKSLNILDEEASYAIKLIDLNNRGMKIFYKRFKDKVSKIKSHLNSEQVAELQVMEKNGKLNDIHKPLNITGALKIADAEKRLKLQGHEKPKSAIAFRSKTVLMSNDSLTQRGNTSGRNSRRPSTCHASYQNERLSVSLSGSNSTSGHPINRSNSITGAFIDTQDKSRSPGISPRSESAAAKTKKKHVNSTEVNTNSSTTNKSKIVKSPETLPMKEHLPTVAVNKTKNVSQMVKRERPPSHDNNSSFHNEGKSKHVRIDAERTLIGITIEESIAEEPVNSNHVQSSVLTTSSKQTENCSPILNQMAVPRAGCQKFVDPSTSKNLIRNNSTNTNGEIENNQTEKHVKISESFDLIDDRPGTQFEKRSISRSSKYSAVSKQSTTSAGQFSCHSNVDRPISSRAETFKGGEEVFGGYLGEDPYEKRRKSLLQGEEDKLDDLQDKKDDFLDEIDRYISSYYSRNRAPSIAPVVLQLPESVLEDIRKARAEERANRRLKRMQRKMQKNSLSVEDKRRRASMHWKDVNKCRYLRVPSEKIDLSGIVTLASEQMKLFKNMRQQDTDQDHDHDTDYEDDY